MKLFLMFLGGLGYDLLLRVLISEELAYGCTGLGVTILGNDLAATPLLLGGREDQKKKYLGQLTSEPVLTVCLFLAFNKSIIF